MLPLGVIVFLICDVLLAYDDESLIIASMFVLCSDIFVLCC